MIISAATMMEQSPQVFPQMLYKHLASSETLGMVQGSLTHDRFFFMSFIQAGITSQLNLILKKKKKLEK